METIEIQIILEVKAKELEEFLKELEKIKLGIFREVKILEKEYDTDYFN